MNKSHEESTTMKTLKVWMAVFTVFLVHVGMSPAQSNNVLRLPATQMNNIYQLDSYLTSSATNFADGSYTDHWLGQTYNGSMISYRLDRLYDLTTFKYADDPNINRVNGFEIAAGSGSLQSYTDTSVPPTPMTGSIGRRGGYIRWHASPPCDANNGGSEFEVWGTPTLYRRIPNPSIYTNYQEYSGYAVTNVVGDNLVKGYASAGGWTNTYIVFDFGSPTTVSAVEIWDRNAVSGIQGAQLIFSDNLTFGDAGAITVTYTKAVSDPATVVDLIAQGHPNGVARRYVKWQVTVSGPDGNNNGMNAIAFYATPQVGTVISIH